MSDVRDSSHATMMISEVDRTQQCQKHLIYDNDGGSLYATLSEAVMTEAARMQHCPRPTVHDNINVGNIFYATTLELVNMKYGCCLYAIMPDAAHNQ